MDKPQVLEDDDFESDWEILRRQPQTIDGPTVIDMAEAIERVCKAVVDYAILLDDDPKERRRLIEDKNQFPVFTIVPHYDRIDKKRQWKVMVVFEMMDMKWTSDAHDRCESAVEELFSKVAGGILKKAEEYVKEADEAEKESAIAKDTARKLKRLKLGMGEYATVQPNLPIKPD